MITMLRKVVKKLPQFRSVHHTNLPSDIFEGVVINKCKIVKKRLPLSKYGGRQLVTMLPGEPPGPILMQYVRDVYKVARIPVDFEILEGNFESQDKINKFNDDAITSIRRNGVAIKGNIPNPVTSSNVTLRTQLDLFVCLVHCRSYKNIRSKFSDMDIYICRQNTEGEYAMLEHQAKPGVVESLKIITRENTARLARWTFEFAKAEQRKKITIVHKANIMKLSDGLFMETIKAVSKDYPEIEVDDMIVDNCTMQLVRRPQYFDVIITPNLYGNILSNILFGLIGGAGLMSGENYGSGCALFEAGSRHLTYSDEDIRILNPIAMLNASVDLLYYLEIEQQAEIIENAIEKTISVDKIHTPDIGGTNTCDEVVESVKENIRKGLKQSSVKMF